MSDVVRGIQQQQRRREDAAVRVPVSPHRHHGSADLDHPLLRSVLQSLGRETVYVQYNVELLFAAHRPLGPRQISRERVQPRQHLESTCFLRSYWYAYIIQVFDRL